MLVQNAYRRRRSWWALAQAIAIATTPTLIMGVQGAALGALLFFLIGPKYVNWRVRLGAWHDDDNATKDGARAIRNRLRDRQEIAPLPAAAGPWLEYVNDVVRARREEGYKPPETVPTS